MEKLSTPLPPPALVSLVAGHTDVDRFAESRLPSVNRLIEVLDRCGIDFRSLTNILDFGCGCGRTLAGWEHKLGSDTKLYGIDVNEELVNFCVSNIPYANVIKTGYYPPVPFEDNQFDFVYSASVFTHLTIPACLYWAGEMNRLIKGGGIMLLSFHGSYYNKILIENSAEGFRDLEKNGCYVYKHFKDEDKEKTFLGSNLYATFHKLSFFQRVFVGFELLNVFPSIIEGPSHFSSHQDIAIFRRCSASD